MGPARRSSQPPNLEVSPRPTAGWQHSWRRRAVPRGIERGSCLNSPPPCACAPKVWGPPLHAVAGRQLLPRLLWSPPFVFYTWLRGGGGQWRRAMMTWRGVHDSALHSRSDSIACCCCAAVVAFTSPLLTSLRVCRSVDACCSCLLLRRCDRRRAHWMLVLLVLYRCERSCVCTRKGATASPPLRRAPPRAESASHLTHTHDGGAATGKFYCMSGKNSSIRHIGMWWWRCGGLAESC